MIIVHHSRNVLHWSWLQHAPETMFQGVSFFFVLSGFILTHVYSTKAMPPYGSFVRARFARLWPVHVLAIVFLVSAVPEGSITFDGPGIFDKWVVLGFNLALVHSIFPFLAYTFSWNAVSWSISTEFFFYLAFPLLLVNIERTWGWKLLGTAVMASALLLILRLSDLPISSENFNQATAYFASYPSPVMRIFEFVLGMSTWVVWNKYVRPRQLSPFAWTLLEVGVLALCVFWLGYAGSHIYSQVLSNYAQLYFGPAGSCWVFALLIGIFASSRGALARSLSWRPVMFLGEISFSIYMLHQILIKVFVATLGWPAVPEVVFFPVLFLIASVSYLLVEKPGQRFLSGNWRKTDAVLAVNPQVK